MQQPSPPSPSPCPLSLQPTNPLAAPPPPLSTLPAPYPDTSLPLSGHYTTLTGLQESHIPSLWTNLHITPHTPATLLQYLPWRSVTSAPDLYAMLRDLQQQMGVELYAIQTHPASLNTPSAPAARTATLGIIGYLNISLPNRAIEVGAVVFSPLLQRTAAATEAVALLMRNALEYPLTSTSAPYRRVVWKCDSRNAASYRAAVRLGFVYEGTWRNHMLMHGESRDSAWFSVVDADWEVVGEALRVWLDPANFEEGRQRASLEEVRGRVKGEGEGDVPAVV